MAIQVRRGQKADFDPNKMLPGEWAVSIDSDTENQIVWMCFSAGVVKRMGTYEDFKQQIYEITQNIKEEYLIEFNAVLEQVEKLASQTQENADAVIQIESSIVNTYIPQILEYFNGAEESASSALISETNASQSAYSAKSCMTNAMTAAQKASVSEKNAKTSETNALAYAQDASAHSSSASQSAANAETYADNAYTSSSNAAQSEGLALSYANVAIESAEAANTSKNNAEEYALKSQSYAVGTSGAREGEATDNAKHYYERSKEMYENFVNSGDVTGVKGDAETDYRSGNVNITPENIGIIIDTVLSSESTNSVQNKVVTAALDKCAKIGAIGYSDVNNLVNEGMYIAYRCSNVPDGLEYCGVIVAKAGMALNDTKIRQIAFNGNGYDMYTRYTSDYTDGDAWSEWKKMLMDISQSTVITTVGKYALDAVQNNASVKGTLANKLAKTYCGTGSATSSNGTFTLTVPAGYKSAIAQIQGLWGSATVSNVSLSGTTLSIATNVTGEYTFTFAYMLFK